MTTEKTTEEYAAENRAVQRRLARSMIIEEIILAMVRGGTTMEEGAMYQRAARLADRILADREGET